MNAPSSSSNSSAAAIADSTSTAANTKSAGDSDGVPATGIKLLIKASNQQFADESIVCDLEWSVRRLKMQLSQVYPCKPAVSEQKLIYSGQLLKDSLLLKDVIRSYKDVYTQHHIFHLVFAARYSKTPTAQPKTKAAMASNTNSTSSSFTTEGLRYRNNSNNTAAAAAGATAQQQQQQQQQQEQQQTPQQQSNAFGSAFIPHMVAGGTAASAASDCPTSSPSSGPNMMPFSFPGELRMQPMATQQAAMYNWMQQVYSQYMDQWIRLSNNSSASTQDTSAPTSNMPSLPTSPFPIQTFLQVMPSVRNSVPAANLAAFAATGAATPMPFQTPAAPEAVVAAANTSPPAPQVDAAAAAAAAGQQPPNRVAAAERQAPRFPNLMVGEEQEQRDWLDSFFSLMRLGIFLAILFFNTSPIRILIVVVIAGGIYLYNRGFFRIRTERNNNNINRNNNAANQIRRGVQDVQQAQAQQQRQQPLVNLPPHAAGEVYERAAAPQPTVDRSANTDFPVDTTDAPSSVISIIRELVVSFLTSLLPEAPTH